MKNLFVKSMLIVAVISLITLISTCKKDTECKAVVTVKYYYDTTIVVPGSYVSIKMHDTHSEGTTDGSGVFNTTFKLEAILEITATKDTSTIVHNPPIPLLTGAAVIRLQPGKTVYKTVFIQ